MLKLTINVFYCYFEQTSETVIVRVLLLLLLNIFSQTLTYLLKSLVKHWNNVYGLHSIAFIINLDHVFLLWLDSIISVPGLKLTPNTDALPNDQIMSQLKKVSHSVVIYVIASSKSRNSWLLRQCVQKQFEYVI